MYGDAYDIHDGFCGANGPKYHSNMNIVTICGNRVSYPRLII